MKKALLIAICHYLIHASHASNQDEIRFEDYRYDENIKSDLLYPDRGFEQDAIQGAIIPINSSYPLVLEFDELYYDYQDYYAKIIHCNADWKKSTLSDFDFTTGYNEYPIREFEYSQGTLIPYTHYRFEVPRTRISGNYLLMIYRNNIDDVILTRRFVVTESRVQIRPRISVMTGATGRFENHQIEFEVNYGSLQVMNPYQDISVIIRQNQRWDNIKKDLKPTQVREDLTTLRYHHFTGENVFPSINEFRFADIRATTFKGQNVVRIEKDTEPVSAHLRIDIPRANEIYSQYSDLNGNYVIENNDPGAQFLEEDYILVNFYLDREKLNDQIFVMGAFNHWQKDIPLRYDQERQLYMTEALLKQGYYNYIYYLDNRDSPYELEGAFFEAENDYEIIVYFRNPRTFADTVVGYISFNSNN